MNQSGFFTYTSQPGGIISNTCVYKSVWHRKTDNQEDIITGSRVSRKQRPYIRGYMKQNMASYIIDKLQDHPYLFARSTNYNNRPINDDCLFGSVLFIGDNPVQ
jgi:hypothetical protein